VIRLAKEGGLKDSGSRRGLNKLGMVQRVRGIHAELDVMVFGHREGFHKADVNIVHA